MRPSWADLPPARFNAPLDPLIRPETGVRACRQFSPCRGSSPIKRILPLSWSDITNKPIRLYADARAKSSILIGNPNARRGDYSLGIEGGSGIIMKSDYLDWIEQAKHEFSRADEGQIHFCFCSNEPGSCGTGIDSLTVPPLSMGLLISCFLSLCDVIMTPIYSASGRIPQQNPIILHLFSEISG